MMNWSVGVAIGPEISSDFGRGISGRAAVAATSTASVKAEGHGDDDGRGIRRRLRTMDEQLWKGNLKLAVNLVKQLQRLPPPTGLGGFAAARQVPRRITSVEELNLSPTEASAVQSLLDSILDSIKTSLQSWPPEEVSVFGVESSISGENNSVYLEDDIIEPKFPSTEDVKQDKVPDACVQFVGFDFLREIEDVTPSTRNLLKEKSGHQANRHQLSSTVLSRFLCVILGGLVAEHLVFGNSKGHHADVEKLDRVLKWLKFTEDEANTIIRWAVLNTLLILRRHGEATSALAEAMAHGRSIGNCIHTIETTLNHGDI